MAPARKTFHFSLVQTPSAWRWQALDSAGAVIESGLAPSRKLAAACVIRALAGRASGDLTNTTEPHATTRSAQDRVASDAA